MTRWKPKHTKEQVLEFYKKNPDMRSTEMAEHLECSSSYIRATLARAGIRLASSKRKLPSLCGINQNLRPDHPDIKYIILPRKRKKNA